MAHHYLFKLLPWAGLENCTCLLVFTSGSWVRASGNFQLLARQDKYIFGVFVIVFFFLEKCKNYLEFLTSFKSDAKTEKKDCLKGLKRQLNVTGCSR